MELANALYKIDMLVDDQGRTAEKEAWNFIRAYIAEVQKPAHNKQSTPCCENCGGKLVTTCVNKKCDWSPVT